jgi:stage II sporulation SpoE-like protein
VVESPTATVVVPLTEDPPAPVDLGTLQQSTPAPTDVTTEPPLAPGQPVMLTQSPGTGGGAATTLTIVAPANPNDPVLVLDSAGTSEHNAGLVLLTAVPESLSTRASSTGAPITRFSVQSDQGPSTILVFDSPRRVAFGSDLNRPQPTRLVAASGWVSGLVRGVVIPRATTAGVTAPTTKQQSAQPRRHRAERPRSHSRSGSGSVQSKRTSGSPGAAEASAAAPVSDAASSGAGTASQDRQAASPKASRQAAKDRSRKKPSESTPERAIRQVGEVVKVIPPAIKWLLAALGAAAVVFGGAAGFAALRARRARRQSESLWRDKSLLEEAIGSKLPERTPGLAVSAAYRAAEGPGSGGDFYEVVALDRGRTAFVVGDISGHDREAVVAATQVRKALRAYLLAGLEPRQVIQVATHAQLDQLAEHFATVTVAVYEPVERELIYASAGHPPPLTADGPLPTPQPVCPPIGVAVGAVVQQETVRLERGRPVLLHTDGLSEARTGKLGMLGRDGLARLLGELPDADRLSDRVRELGGSSDDMVACILIPGIEAPAAATPQTEPLTVSD